MSNPKVKSVLDFIGYPTALATPRAFKVDLMDKAFLKAPGNCLHGKSPFGGQKRKEGWTIV